MSSRVQKFVAKLIAAGSVLTLLTFTSGGSSAAVVDQFTFFDSSSLSHTASKYLQPTTSGPSNWVSPTNYAAGRMYLRLEVVSRPSTKPLDVQICVWRNSYVQESCSPTARLANAGGVQWIDLGSPANWWKKNGTWSWTTAFSPTRLMIKDVASGKLLMTSNCGASCYTGSDIASHVPINVKAAAIVVAPGATLQPPSSWAGCPTSWSPQCGSGTSNSAPVVDAGPNVQATVGAPIALNGSVTDDGRPTGSSLTIGWSKQSGPGTVGFTPANAASTSATFSQAGTYVVALSASDSALSATDTTTVTVTDTPPPPTGGTAALLASSTTLPTADRPLRARLESLGYTVTVVDDDAAATAPFTSFDLVVVSSSVVPTKVPTTLATAAVPVLNLEAYATTRLGLGTSGSELASQQSIDVLSTHPAVGGLAGRVQISSSSTFGRAVPPASATALSRIAGRTNDIMSYVIDEGGALTAGTAAARRGAFLTGYPLPPLLNANGWTHFDALVRWLAPAEVPEPEPWLVAGLTHRQVLTVDPAGVSRTDRLVALPFVGNVGAAFDPATIDVIEVDADGAALDDTVPMQFEPASTFHATTNPQGTLVLQLEGTTTGPRRFHVYYGAQGLPTSAPTPAVVTLTQNVTDEGHPAYLVDTPAGDWYYHTAGGGFSSLVDPSGNDWLQWNATFGSAGTYRGIPNAVYPAGYLHPGFTNSSTELVSSGPLRVSFQTTTSNGAFVVRWDISARSATMSVLRADTAYWFLYEGTPGGQIDPTTDKVIRGNGTTTNLSAEWVGDVPGEWVAFADTVRNSALFVSQVTDDSIVDSYRLMENNMTVFGFGRQNVASSLTGQRQFVVGLTTGSTFAAIEPVALGETRPITTTWSAAEQRPG